MRPYFVGQGILSLLRTRLWSPALTWTTLSNVIWTRPLSIGLLIWWQSVGLKNIQEKLLSVSLQQHVVTWIAVALTRYERPCYIMSSMALESYCTTRNRYQLEGPRQAHTECEESDRIGVHRTIRHGCPQRSWDLNLSARATLRVNHSTPHTTQPPSCHYAKYRL
jgi:hypothetical protein